jgi:hypothetical protein
LDQSYRILPADARDWGRKQGIPEPPEVDCNGQPAAVATISGAAEANSQQAAGGVSSSGQRQPALVITSPAPNSTLAFSPQLPAEFQKIEVSARLNTPSPVRRVELIVDGRSIATFTRLPYRVLWSLAAGEHTVQAVGEDMDGRRLDSDVIHFQVEPPQQE